MSVKEQIIYSLKKEGETTNPFRLGKFSFRTVKCTDIVKLYIDSNIYCTRFLNLNVYRTTVLSIYEY